LGGALKTLVPGKRMPLGKKKGKRKSCKISGRKSWKGEGNPGNSDEVEKKTRRGKKEKCGIKE